MIRALRLVILLATRNSPLATFLFLLFAVPASAQVATGTPPFGSFSGGPEIINNANLNAHWTIPVLHKPGRGTSFTYDLSYDSSVWYPVTSGSSESWQPVINLGWAGQTQTLIGYITYSVVSVPCKNPVGPPEYEPAEVNWVYYDKFGVAHPFNIGVMNGPGSPPCPYPTRANSLATDGSGYTIYAQAASSAYVVSASGQFVYAPVQSISGGATMTDRNGNEITVDSSGHFYDTLSATTPVLTASGSGTATSPIVLTYTAPSGANASYTMNYTNYTVATNFGNSSIHEYKSSAAVPLLTSIVLPDNSQYTITYEPTPTSPSQGACTPYSGTTCVTARIASITLPTGGTISYLYYNSNNNFSACTSGNNGIFPDGSASCLQRTTPDGTWTYTRTLGTGAASTTTITDPSTAANQTAIQFQGIYETQRQAYAGSTSGTLMKTIVTCYNASAPPCTGTAVNSPITQQDTLPSVPSAASVTLQSKHTTKYNSVGAPIELDDYAFGSGSYGGLLRQTLITYASLPPNITAFRQTVTAKNGGGTVLEQTNYNYDQTTPVNAPSGTPQLTSVSGSRGNLTSVQRCTNLTNCSTYVQTTMTYDTAGQLQTLNDPLNTQTSFSYTDSFFKDDGNNPPAGYTSSVPTDAFVTSVTLPVSGSLSYGYYYYSGEIAKVVDQNTNTSYNHYQDLFARPTSTLSPPVPVPGTQTTASPWTLNVYAASHMQVDTYLAIDDTTSAPSSSCTSCRHDEAILDGLGRTLSTYLKSDPEGPTEVDTVYDALGRVKTASHPYRSTNDTTYGIETPTYDALGRTIKLTHQDHTYSQTAFGAAVSGTGVKTAQVCSSTTYGLGYPSLFTEEAGKMREIWTDAFGRTIEADEPDSTGALNSNTCYSYDPLGNLLQVVHGTQTRSFTYDSLSRQTTITKPESGTVCIGTYSSGVCQGNGYNANGNIITVTVPAPNQTGTATVTITLSYDALNRLTKKTYSDGSPTIQYGYDGTALTGCTTTAPSLTDSNPKGRMTSMCDSSGATSWAHDALGRIITEKRIILGTSPITLSYTYNLDGSIATVTYPSGKKVTYTVNNAQRPTAATDTANNIQFAGFASYAATGALQGMTSGKVSAGFAGISETHGYDSSLEYTSTKATSTTGTAMDLTLNYALSGGDNGTLTSITNNVDPNRNTTFQYDTLNRISSATTQGTSGIDCWGLNFGPDALANLNAMTSTQCSPGALSVTVDANNHINSGLTVAYDAPGNMTKDGSSFTYTFDDNGHLTIASGMTNGPYCYVYDGNGARVAKKSNSNSTCSTGTVVKLYWRSLFGDALAETDGSGNSINEYVFFAGRRVASRNSSGNVFYWFADQLGSTRTITDANGNLCYDAEFTPYGQEISHSERLQTTPCAPSYKFTGYERDPETTAGASDTGLDYAFARYYSSRLGRFLSPDLPGGSIGRLQSHNAYAYVVNNPMNLTDPTGLTGSCPGSPLPPGPGGVCHGPVPPGGVLGPGNGLICFIDGLQVPCDIAVGQLLAGGTALCPNNDCTGINVVQGPGGVGLIQQWVVAVNVASVICITTADGNIACPPIPEGTTYSGYWEPVGTFSIDGSYFTLAGSQVSCNSTTGICVPASALPPPGQQDPLKKAVKWYLCGKNAADNTGNYMVEGMVKTGIVEAIDFGVDLGARYAVVGGSIGSVVGMAVGGLLGAGASTVCWLGGAYGPSPLR